jgi:hypothetical protein
VVTDLIARLTAALDDSELHPLHQLSCQMLKQPPEGFPFATFTCNCDGPNERRRMVAAHRKILALHDPLANLDATSPHARERFTKGYYCPTCGGRDWDIEEIGDEPCDTVKALAEAYGIEA